MLTLDLETLQKAYDNGGKFARNFDRINKELQKQEAGEPVDYAVIINVINDYISFHKSGKIELLQSIDSSATGCKFCEIMRNNPDPDCICHYCYDYAQEHSYKAGKVLPAHWLLMKVLSSFDIPVEYFRFLKLYTSNIRINSSGDIVNLIHAENIIKIALCFPDFQFGLWSKNVCVVNKAFDNLGKPSNIRFVQSSYAINKPAARSRYADTVFTVYTADHIAEAIENGANVCNGKKCLECGFKCYKKPEAGGWEAGTNTAELLRK